MQFEISARARLDGLKSVEETVPFFIQQTLALRVQVLPGLLGKAADSVLAEYRFEQFLPDYRRAARDADFQTTQACRHGEHHHHECSTKAVDPEGQPPCLGPLPLALCTDHLHETLLPGTDCRGRFGVETLACSGEVVAAQELAARRVRPPAPVNVFGRRGSFIEDDRLQPGFDRSLHLYSRRRFATEKSAHTVPHAADVLLQGPKELARSHKILPPCQDFSAEKRPILGGFKDAGERVLVFLGA